MPAITSLSVTISYHVPIEYFNTFSCFFVFLVVFHILTKRQFLIIKRPRMIKDCVALKSRSRHLVSCCIILAKAMCALVCLYKAQFLFINLKPLNPELFEICVYKQHTLHIVKKSPDIKFPTK